MNDLQSEGKEDLPIFVKWMDFVKWLLVTTDGFPKKARFTFSERMVAIALLIIEDLIEARYSKNKIRICSSHFRDRFVHHAICNLIEPLLEKKLISDTYACRAGKGAHLAVKRCRAFIRQFKFYLKCDIQKFFESIDHEILKSLLRRTFKDEKLLSLMAIIIDHKVPGNRPGKGVPIGNLTSQHLANFYLGFLDHFVKDRLGMKGYLRYMDDFISFSDDKEALHDLLAQIRNYTSEVLGLKIKEKVTVIAPVSEGVPFLGFRIFPGLIRIKRENLVRFRQKIRKKEEMYLAGKLSEKSLVQSVNSMIGHISHVNSAQERRRIFDRSLILA
ncbi:MAG: reverse transcriptase domain-containing protein [Bdellovibrio sp.]